MAKIKTCVYCGGRHSKQEHTGEQLGAARQLAMLRAREERRKQRVDAERASGERYRAGPDAGAAAPGPVEKRPPCTECSDGRRYGQLPWCRRCAMSRGFRACPRCGVLVESHDARPSDGRCKSCVDKPTCTSCGVRTPVKKLEWCMSCALRRGWRQCSGCSKVFKPPVEQPRRRRCAKCIEKGIGGGKRGGGSSIYTVSGGLPGSGRRHLS
jgi:hypothetical protein